MDKDAGVSAIRAAYSEASEDAKLSLLNALRTFGTDDAVALVMEELRSGSEAVKDAAFRSLSSWDNANAISELLELAKDSATPTKYQVLALRGVNRIMVSAQDLNPKERIEGVLDALKAATRPEEQALALSSLAQLKTSEAFDAFSELLDNEALRNNAAMSGLQLAQNLAREKKKEAREFANKIKAMNISDAITQQADKALSKIK
jgi:hypothetical protein